MQSRAIASRWTVAPRHQRYAVERTLERSGRPVDHDQIIVLPFEAGCGKVRGARAQPSPI